MIYHDLQIGAFLKLEEYADRGVEYFEVLKVDKLLLDRTHSDGLPVFYNADAPPLAADLLWVWHRRFGLL